MATPASATILRRMPQAIQVWSAGNEKSSCAPAAGSDTFSMWWSYCRVIAGANGSRSWGLTGMAIMPRRFPLESVASEIPDGTSGFKSHFLALRRLPIITVRLERPIIPDKVQHLSED